MARYIDQAASRPGDNVTGILLRAGESDDQPWSREEIINCAFLLYMAGLDTVTNMMGFIGTVSHRGPTINDISLPSR